MPNIEPYDPSKTPLPCWFGKDVIVKVVRCDNNNPIYLFNVSDTSGFKYSNQNLTENAFVITCALQGFKFAVGANNYQRKDHILTGQEVAAQFVEICLDAETPPESKPQSCPVKTVLVGNAADEGTATNVLKSYRRFRDEIASTSIGRALVNRYYEDAVKTSVDNALLQNKDLALQLLVLLVETQPFVDSIISPVPYSAPTLDQALADQILAFGEWLNRETGGVLDAELKLLNELIPKAVGRTAAEIFLLLVAH